MEEEEANEESYACEQEKEEPECWRITSMGYVMLVIDVLIACLVSNFSQRFNDRCLDGSKKARRWAFPIDQNKSEQTYYALRDDDPISTSRRCIKP